MGQNVLMQENFHTTRSGMTKVLSLSSRVHQHFDINIVFFHPSPLNLLQEKTKFYVDTTLEEEKNVNLIYWNV